MKQGRVYLVGAGPGDPGLLTLRGQSLLRRADVVVYDHLVSPGVLKHCARRARKVYVGKEAARHALTQERTNRLLIRSAKAGKAVVRLKGGDPMLFGRGGEEALALARARVPFEIVPGVTSAVAVPAYAGIPVTHRALSSSVAMVTGHEDPTKGGSAIRWDRLATACDTLIFLMGVSRLSSIVKRLIRHGRRAGTPCAVIEWGTLRTQRAVAGTLGTIATKAKEAGIRPPAIFIVGEVVKLRRQLAWFEPKPLEGRRILVTRASEKARTFADALEGSGAEVEILPAIELVPVASNGRFRDAVRSIPRADWVFFTSPEGIGWLRRMLKPMRVNVRCLSGCRVGAIGPKTASAVEDAGVRVDVVPRRFSQEGLLEDLPRRLVRGKRGFIFSAAESRDALETGLRARGMAVERVPVYRTRRPRAMAARVRTLFRRPFDFVTVTSASCVAHVQESLREAGLGRRFRRLPFASIGPVTSQAVRAHGGRVAVEAKTATIEGLLTAMAEAGGDA